MTKNINKQTIRAEMLQHRNSQAPKKIAALSRIIQERLLASEAWWHVRRVGLYVGVNGEVATDLLLARAWQEKLSVLLPRCSSAAGEMEFVPCSGREDLHPARFGLLEPKPDLKAVPRDNLSLLPELIVVPAVAFDRKGRRIGYGGGYYDRYLSRMPSPPPLLIGLAFAFQLVDTIPADSWDYPMHGICTEDTLLWM